MSVSLCVCECVCVCVCVCARGGGVSRDFTINLSPQCRGFSRALKTEKLKASLFPGPVGSTNDWCITGANSHLVHAKNLTKISFADVSS